VGSTVTATTFAPRARIGGARRPAVSGVMLRGLFSKNMKPTKAAPPSRAACTASGVVTPQILALAVMGPA
jgi:hypothetical protein